MRRTFVVLTVLLAVLICIPAHGQAAYKLLNAGSNASKYDVVVLHATTANAFTTTTTASHGDVLGVLAEDVANGASGVVILPGSISTVLVSGSVTQGDYLATSTTAGAVYTVSGGEGVIAIAFDDATDGNTVRCMIMGPTVLSATNNMVVNDLQVNGTLDVVGVSTVAALGGTTLTASVGVIAPQIGPTGDDDLLAMSSGAATINGTLDATGAFTAATIDGTIGSVTPAAGTFTTFAATTIDGSVGSVTPAAGAFTTLDTSGAFTIAGADGANFDPVGDVDVDLLTVDVTDAPRFWWDEDPGVFASTIGFNIVGASDVDGAFTAGSVASDGAVSGTTGGFTGVLTVAVAAAASELEIGTAGQIARIDLIGDSTYADYGLQIQRSSGPDGVTTFTHRGTGTWSFVTDEAAGFDWHTDSVSRMTIVAGGAVDAVGAFTAGSIASDADVSGTGLTLTAAESLILSDTSDASDNKQVKVCGGGGSATTRGASISLYGNEHATSAGDLNLSAGNVAGGIINMTTAGVSRLTIAYGGGVDVVGAFTAGSLSSDGDLLVEGLDIGFTTDPNLITLASNLLTVNGTLTVIGAMTANNIVAGVDGVTRGSLVLWEGADGTTPGYVKFHSPNGTAWYLFVEDDGTLKIYNGVPTQNSDGSEVGGQS